MIQRKPCIMVSFGCVNLRLCSKAFAKSVFQFMLKGNVLIHIVILGQCTIGTQKIGGRHFHKNE